MDVRYVSNALVRVESSSEALNCGSQIKLTAAKFKGMQCGASGGVTQWLL